MDLTGLHVGNYVVTRKLGGGGMGTVWLCEHPLLGRKAALKALHEEHAKNPELVERFFTEAKAANEIRHPHIVEVQDFGWAKDPTGTVDFVYLIMEYLDGGNLAQALPTLSIEDGVHILKQCCSALEASHQKGIVHRDLKPENIFLVDRLGDPLFVKIVDFGIAKLLGPHQGGKTRLGTVLGTPSYMSPEQCEGLGKVDHRADIYSLGVVFYEMVTKRLPFVGKNFAEVVVGHMSVQPTPPSQINPRCSRELEAIILRAMEKRPARRFQSMAEMAAALDDPATHALAYLQLRAEQPTMPADRSGHTLLLEGSEVPRTTPVPAPPAPEPLVAPMPSHPSPLPMIRAIGENTLQRASGEVERAPKKSHRGLWWGLGGGLAIAGLIAGALLSQPEEPPPSPAAVTPTEVVTPPAPEPPVVPPRVKTVLVRSDPPGAQVTNLATHALIGDTPVTLRLVEGGAAIEVQITRTGYRPARMVLAPDGPAQVAVVLEAIAPPPPPPPPPTTVAPVAPVETKPTPAVEAKPTPAVESKPKPPAKPKKRRRPVEL